MCERRGEEATRRSEVLIPAPPLRRVLLAVLSFIYRMTFSPIVLAGVTLALTLLVLLFLIAILSHCRKASPTRFDVIGSLASVEKDLRPEGAVIVRGELWRARARDGRSVARGRLNVRVVGASRHLLEVEALDEAKP
ncbi:MAG TPA: NfeD family protein [Pyrinomonadaceae bacterium]|nr:NfeD family protein [Pyrinomonadaceae bacterium]